MFKNKDEGDIPSNEEIVSEVVDSFKNLEVNDNISNEMEKSQKENKDGVEVEDDQIDEIYLKDLDAESSSENLEDRKKLAIEAKALGNSLFKNGDFENAKKKYTEALRICPLKYEEERAMLYGNRAAAKIKENLKKEAIEDCNKAIELNPNYAKVLTRRAKLYEESDKLDEAFEDFQKLLELEPGNSEARAAVMRLPDQINERNEKLKAEMLGSLKELGNKLLKPFGLSTDNFQVQQDPNSGGYSINFTQNKK